jgi:hypothetical protein
MAELDLIMRPYIDSGNYTEEELEKIRKLEYNKLQQNTRETSWWKGEEGWIPDELQPGVNRPRVKKEKPSVVDEFLETTNDQTEIQKRKDHSAATASLQPGDKEIPYRVEEDGNYRQDGTLIKEDDVYDPERKDASSVLDEIGESASGMALPFGISWVALAKVKNPRIRAIGALGLAFGFDQIVPDSDEEEDIVEETDDYGNVPIVDFFDDVYNNIQQGYGRSKGVEPGLQVQNFTGGDVNELRKNIKELYENDLVLAAKGQTDEQRSYQKVYDNNKKKHGKIMAWMMAIKENPSFLAQTSANSIANMAGTFANSGTARERMGIAGATTYASGQGVNKLLKKNKIGQLTSFLSGAYGANSMTMEQSYTFVDLMKEQLAADGKEFNPENIENLILDKEITTFKDPRFSTLDITGTKFEIMKKRALRRGVSIGFVDAVSGGITGQFIGPGNKIKALSLPGFAVPVAGGLTSEIAGQTAGGQEYDAGEILTEGFAEKGGPMVLLNTTRDIVDKIKNPPLYKINGEQFTKSQFLDYTNKMSDQDISKIKIEVENDQDVALDIRERRHRATIDNEIDSSITDPKDRKRLIDLEIQRAILENNQKTKKGSRKVVGNEKKLERTEEKINSILSKYEGVKREDVRSQADVGIAQSKADVKFENNMAFAKKHSSLYGLKYQELSQQEIKEKYGERFTIGAGFVDSNNNLVINREQAQKQMFGDYVGNHELLHGIIKASGAKIKQGTINNFLKLIGKDNAALLQKKINENKDVYTDEYLAKNRDEYFTIFSDLLADAKKAKQQGREYVQLDTNVMTQIKDWVRRVLADLGFANVDFETAEGALNFLKDYNKSIHKGALSRGVVKATKGKADMTGGTVMSRSQHLTKEQATKKINELGKRFESKDGSVIDFEKEHGNVMFKGYAPEIWDQIQEEGILDGLILAQPHEGIDSRDFLDTTYAELFSWFEKYEPERKNESGLFGHVNPQIPNRAKQAYNVITKGEIKYTEEIGETTKEGEIKIQVEAEPDTYMEAFETEDMSPQAVAKREAQKNKKKEVRKSKLRQDLGIEDNSDLYNKVKDSARQSLILAYQKTRDIENKNDRAAAIAKIIADEYAGEKGITSGKYTELFKLIKNSLGNKAEYVKNLKKNRESIVESIFTSDFVQIERKVPENEKVFIVFKEKLTSKKQVEDAVNKILLPKDSLKAIDKGQAVNLYGKVMPTPDQFVGFFNQPLTIEKTDKEGNVYHIRSGLKGTRKDGLAKHLSKALIFDALMEVRQEDTVNKLLTEEFNAELDVVDLASKISRDVDVKFSKSNAATDINNAIDSGTNTDVYNEIRFSKSHRVQYEKRLEKNRPDLTEEQRKNAVQSIFDFVDGKDIPSNKKAKLEKLAMHYTANGYLILPEDGYKVIEAERIATIKKLDAFSYKNPNVLLEENVVREKVKRTDPDIVGTFSNKTEYSDGVVVYDVEDSKQGQLDTRKVIDTHFGKNANPWCLCARQKEEIMDLPDMEIFDNREEAETMKMVFEETGRYETVNVIPIDWNQSDGSVIPQWMIEANLPKEKPNPNYNELREAWTHWKDYNENGEGLGFRIAFHNGELVGFRDGKESPRWWDRRDKPSDAPMIKGKKGKDGYRVVSLAYKNKTIPQYLEKVTGDNKTGVEIRKDLNGTVTDITSKKDGFRHGKQFRLRDDRTSYYSYETTSVWNNGDRISIKEERTYKDHKGESGTESFTNGRDELTLNNITKYERFFSEKSGETIVTIEGTVNQNLTASNERYYSRQGEKITLNEKRSRIISTKKDHVVTINGEVQERRVKFSASQKKEVEHELTSREENILLPSYLNKEINRLKNIQDISTEESELLEILETMQDLSGSGAVNIYSIMLNAFPYAFKNLVVADFSSEQSFVDAIKKNTQAQMKINAYTTSKRILEKQTRGLIKNPELAVPIIVDYLINVGRDVRSALIVKRNKALKIDVIDELHDGKFKDYFKAEETFEGSGKYKMQYKNSQGEFVNVEIYDSVKKIKENINNPGFRNEFNKQAERAQESRLNTLDPENTDLTLADKLDNIELSNTGTRGVGRKTAKVDVTVTVDMDPSELVLEHEVTIKNMKSYERAYARGDISREQMKSVYEQNKVHILPKSAKSIGAKKLKKLGITEGIDDILKRVKKVSQRQGMGYESIPSVEEYLRDLHDKGIIDKLPNSLDQSFERQSENFKDVVLFSKSSKKPTKGITILDFDDTLATSSSLIRFTRPDGTKGTLTPEQYASTYQDLLGLDYEFDFSEFNKVVDGKPAPLLNKAKKLAGKFGTDNMFILTARPQQSAPAIQKFLKENGLDIPLKNITGLGNSTADAKALWVLDKAAEGYNDFYFADDAIQNVKAVQNMLDQIDVKSKVQQARVKFSVSQSKYFNSILEDVSKIPGFERFSEKVGEARGKGKGKFRVFIPPSHEDFIGLLYNFMGRGKKGNNHRKFFETTLIKPLNRAYRKINEYKQVIANNYKKIKKSMPDVHSKLGEKIPNTDFTYEQAIRIYLWNKAGYKIPGFSKNQETTLVNIVKSYPDLQRYADMVSRISLIKEGYIKPDANWLSGSIKFDLIDGIEKVHRKKVFSEFIENTEEIFGKLDGNGKLKGDNINKIRAIYGDNFVEALNDILYRTINGTNRRSGDNRIVNAWLDWINGSVGATMFFNVRSMMLQQLSIVNFMNFADNNIFKAAARFADQPQFWADWAMIFNSNYLKQRRAGAAFDVNANEIAREVSGAKHPARVVIRRLLDIGFTPTQIGDSFAIAVGGAGFYRNRVNTYLKQGLSQKEAESKAFIDFQQIAEETQQSARPDMISQQQASPLGRFILAFQNVTSQYARLMKKSLLDLVKRRISKGYTTQAQSDMANISRIIWYGTVQSMIFYSLQTALFAVMFGDDEEDEKLLTKKERVINGTIDSLLRGTGVYGAIASTLKNYVIKLVENNKSDKFFKDPAWHKLLQISPPIDIKFRHYKGFERTLQWDKDAIKEMETFDVDNPVWDAISRSAEGFTNVPVNRLYKKIQNIRAGFDSENAWWQRIAVLLGWSKWDVGIEDNDKVKEAKVIRKKNRKKNKDRSGEEANREKKDGGCIATSRSGNRCKNKAESGGYCTIHAEVEQNKTGEKQQCKGQRSSGGRCKMETSSKSGYCYYHD